MPTKPTFPFDVWASNTNWSVGPSSGSATKQNYVALAPDGAIEGKDFPLRADAFNDLQNKLTRWITEWVQQGTSDPDADAHIVETDSTGKIDATYFIARGDSGGAPSIQGIGTSSTWAAQFLSGAGTRTVSISGYGSSTNDIGVRVSTTASSTVGIQINATAGIPLALTPTVADPAFTADNGAFWAIKGSGGTATARAAKFGAGGRNWLAAYQSQHCRVTRAAEGLVAVASFPSQTTLYSSVNFSSDNLPISGVAMMFTVHVEYAANVSAMAAEIEVLDGGTSLYVGNISEAASTSANTRTCRFVQTVAAGSHSFSVRVSATAGTLTLNRSSFVVETFT